MSAFAKLVPSTRREREKNKNKLRCNAFIIQYRNQLHKILEKRASNLKTDWIVSEIEDTETKYFKNRVYNLLYEKTKRHTQRKKKGVKLYGFRINTLQRIIHTLKWTQNKKYLISNIWQRPYDFINREYQLISFEKV